MDSGGNFDPKKLKFVNRIVSMVNMSESYCVSFKKKFSSVALQTKKLFKFKVEITKKSQ